MQSILMCINYNTTLYTMQLPNNKWVNYKQLPLLKHNLKVSKNRSCTYQITSMGTWYKSVNNTNASLPKLCLIYNTNNSLLLFPLQLVGEVLRPVPRLTRQGRGQTGDNRPQVEGLMRLHFGSVKKARFSLKFHRSLTYSDRASAELTYTQLKTPASPFWKSDFDWESGEEEEIALWATEFLNGDKEVKEGHSTVREKGTLYTFTK